MGWDFWRDWVNPAVTAEMRGLGASSDWKARAQDTPKELLQGLGVLPKQVTPKAPGADLDVSFANSERDQMQQLLEELQQQAATGNGAWENTLKTATAKAQGTASALGQSAVNAGGNYQSGLMDIGNAQSGAAQRAVGQGNILREQSKTAAQDQMGQLLGAMGQSDTEQANATARARQQVGATNLALIDQAQGNASAIDQGIASAFSEGGEVPGKPKVFGNSSRNDTVPAMLSPDEVVLPRTISHDPQAAAAFVEALNAGADPQAAEAHAGGVRHMADGGDTGIGNASLDDYGGANQVLSILLPHIGQGAGYGNLRKAAGAGPPSIENGGLLDTANFNSTRAARTGLEGQLMERAGGAGPSIAPQLAQNSTDAAISGAMQARGPASSRIAGATEQAQGGAGAAAAERAGEQQRGQSSAAAVGTQGRAQELSMAEAQQQAAWANTMQNLGLSLANQAALRNMFAGAGQAFTAAAGAGGGAGGGGYTANPNNLTALSDNPFPSAGGDSWETPSFEQGSGLKDGMAFGGTVGGYAGGGRIEGKYPSMPQPKDRSPGVKVKMGDLSLAPTHDKRVEYEEETGDSYQPRAKQAAQEPSTSDRLSDFARSLGASLHFAEGGGVPNFTPAVEASYPPAYFDPSVMWASTGQMPSATPDPEPALPQDRYPPPAGGSGAAVAPLTPTEQSISRDMGTPPTVAHTDAVKSQQARAARDALGIKPGLAPSSSSAPTPAQQQPAPAARPAGGGVALPPAHGLEEGFAENEAQLAAQAQTDAAVTQARAQEAGLAERAKAQADTQIAMREAQHRAQQQTAEAMTRWTAAQEEFSRIDTNVDPGRYWASRTTGQKVLGIIGLALGAAGTGPDGINRAAQMMNQAIDRDLEAQKAEHELKLKKGGQRLQAAQTYYAMAREAGHDDIAATELAKSAALDAAALKAEQLVAATSEPTAKAKGMALSAALRGAAIDKKKSAEQQTFENRVKNQTLNIEAAKVSAVAAKGGLSEGERKSVGDVTAAARDAMGLINSIEGTLSRTQSPVPGKTTFNQHVGGDAAQLDTDTAQLVVKMKDINKLGQLGPADSKLLEEAIGDPKAIFTLESTKRAKLDRIKQIIRDSVANERAARGLQ